MMHKTVVSGLLTLGGAIALTLGTSVSVFAAGFTGVYDPSNFTFIPTPGLAGNAGSDLDTTNAASGEITLFGPDDAFNSLGDLSGSGGASNDWIIAITPERAGTISFSWLYNSLDSGVDDSGGFLLNGVYTPLGTIDGNGSSSPVTISVSPGDTFGFRVDTATNLGGYGYFTVSNFTATPVPFDFSPTLGLGLLSAGWAIQKRRKHLQVKAPVAMENLS